MIGIGSEYICLENIALKGNNYLIHSQCHSNPYILAIPILFSKINQIYNSYISIISLFIGNTNCFLRSLSRNIILKTKVREKVELRYRDSQNTWGLLMDYSKNKKSLIKTNFWKIVWCRQKWNVLVRMGRLKCWIKLGEIR